MLDAEQSQKQDKLETQTLIKNMFDSIEDQEKEIKKIKASLSVIFVIIKGNIGCKYPQMIL